MSSDEGLFRYCLLTLYLIAPATWFSLKFLSAPYGKHFRPGWGPAVSPPLAWFLMESPTLWLSLALFPLGRHSSNPKALLLISPYLLHYFHRTVLYPIRIFRETSGAGRFPVSIAAMAFGFNLLNAYLQSRWVSHYKDDYDSDALLFWWRFCGGVVIFGVGMLANIWADRALLGLKKQGGGGGGGGYYKVPRGGLFELVSCPNYLGEIVEWLGWAVMTWSWAGLAFFIYTCCNLVPRARANHKWYLEKFKDDYPKPRKAVIPFLY